MLKRTVELEQRVARSVRRKRALRMILMIGGILVAVVLFFFLLDWRTAFISFASIPL